MPGDEVSVNYGTADFEDADIGDDKTVTFSGFSLGGADLGNYALAAQPAGVTASILGLSDELAFVNPSKHIMKTYGDAAFANPVIDGHGGSVAVSYSSEDESVATVDGNGTVSMHKAGTTVITARKEADMEYAESSCSYTLTVNPKPVFISVGVANKVYDGTTAATLSGTPAINGLISGDTVTVNYGTAAFATANAGNGKTVTFSGFSLGGSDAGNYTLLAQPTATASITAKPLIVTVGTPSRTLIPFDSPDTQYGTTATFSITVSGIVAPDTVGISLASNSYGITQTAGYTTFTAATGAVTWTVTYNGTTTVTQTSALNIGLIIENGNYAPPSGPVRPAVIDGQATARRIPVTPANISAFNTYARTANGLTRHYRLYSDCTLTGTNNWTPIGTLAAPFTGSFDGISYGIVNLNINTSAEYQGMFGLIGISAVIRSIDLPNARVTGIRCVGGVVAYNSGGTVQDCIVVGAVNGQNYVGGVVGINDGTVQRCTGTVTVNATNYVSYVGGVVGSNRGTMQNCYSTGAVNGSLQVGGVVGYNDGGTVKSCNATGTVNGQARVGGVVGYNDGDTVQNCYATGAVSGTDSVGGVVGLNNAGTLQNCYATGAVSGPDYVGGVVGANYNSTVQNCYATGAVSGTDSVGGVVGRNHDGTLKNCCATGTVSGAASVGGVMGWNGGISRPNDYRVQNCVALNPSVRIVYSSVGRVTGASMPDTTFNNYARSAMTVQYNWNGTTGTNKTINVGLNTVDGANMTTTDAVTASWWTAAGRWSTAGGGTAWDFTNVWNPPSGTRLPTLRNMPAGTQNPVIQN
jgi:hypothetical protein